MDRGRAAKYVNVCTVHTVMECQNDTAVAQIVNGVGLDARWHAARLA